MNIEFYIPKSETIPTRLVLKVDGEHVVYRHLHNQFGYDFEYLDISEERAVEITKQLADIMCSQSYDHGSQWRVVSIAPVEQDERYKIGPIIRVLFRIRDVW